MSSNSKRTADTAGLIADEPKSKKLKNNTHEGASESASAEEAQPDSSSKSDESQSESSADEKEDDSSGEESEITAGISNYNKITAAFVKTDSDNLKDYTLLDHLRITDMIIYDHFRGYVNYEEASASYLSYGSQSATLTTRFGVKTAALQFILRYVRAPIFKALDDSYDIDGLCDFSSLQDEDEDYIGDMIQEYGPAGKLPSPVTKESVKSWLNDYLDKNIQEFSKLIEYREEELKEKSSLPLVGVINRISLMKSYEILRKVYENAKTKLESSFQ